MQEQEQHHHHLTPSDWNAVAGEVKFRGLIAAKRKFIIPATIFFLAYYLALPVSIAFAPRLMSRPVWGPLTLAYAYALSQFVMAGVLLVFYLLAARSFDAREEAIVEDVRKEFSQT